jgi:hypothetical protein
MKTSNHLHTTTTNAAQQSAWKKLQRSIHKDAIQLEHEANTLAKTASVARLLAMAEDEQDAIRVLLDVIGYSVTVEAQKLAQLSGNPVPPAYTPASKLLGGFMKTLAEKTASTYCLLDADEQERVRHILPGFLRALDANDPAVHQMVLGLIWLSPNAVASWIRQNLEMLESRFVS